jgi:hypothetical protein
VQHGLARANFGRERLSDRVEELAKAIGQNSSDPFLYEQAVIIAENQILLDRVRVAKVAAIESCKRQLASPMGTLLLAGFPSLDLDIVLEHFYRVEFKQLAKLITRNTAAIRVLRSMGPKTSNPPKLSKAPFLRNLAEELNLTKDGQSTNRPSDEVAQAECVIMAIPKLLRLERYERRALSRRKRAIRRFDMLRDVT